MEKLGPAYVCGPMRNYPEFNFPLFNHVAKVWRDNGWIIVNPAENFGAVVDLDMCLYLRMDFMQLTSLCKAIILLPDWQSSKNGKVEIAIARALDLEFYDARSQTRIEAPKVIGL